MNVLKSAPILFSLLAAVITLVPDVSLGAGGNRAIVRKASVTSSAALAIAQVALKAAKERGGEAAVAVVDQEGLPLAILRTDYGTEQFVTGAADKAWTSVNFKDSTRAIFETIKGNREDNSQLPHVQRALFLMGGVPLKDGDTVVGAVGVAGFASGLEDDAVAQQAAREFQIMLEKETTQTAR